MKKIRSLKALKRYLTLQCKYVDKVLNARGEDIDYKKYPFTESDYV